MDTTKKEAGKVYLVGAGPGDPGLMTVRCRELIETCEVLVYDALVSAEILAMANPSAERRYVGKRGETHAVEQVDINKLLAEYVRAGRTVLRLKGGDPYLFGRGAEEALYLTERGVPVEVVPGVTAGLAATAYAGIPVTHREQASAVAFVTGHEDPTKPESALDWSALAKVGTLCFYMGVKNLGRIAAELAHHLPPTTPVAVIQWGTTPRQRTVLGTLSDIERRVREARLEAPALTIVGAVCALHGKLNFFERRPLFGRRVVVTRARAQASELATCLAGLGAEVLRFPTIRVVPPEDTRALAAAARHLEHFAWSVFTSVNGVEALFAQLEDQGRDARAFGSCKAAAVGPATAQRLLDKGIRADLRPANYVAEEIVAALRSAGVFQTPLPPRILLPRADLARTDLPQQLRENGADVTEVIAYCTRPETEGHEEAVAALEAGSVDAATFTSASTVHRFVLALGPERLKTVLAAPRLKCLSIGPQTTAALRAANMPVHGEATQHDIPGLVELLQSALKP